MSIFSGPAQSGHRIGGASIAGMALLGAFALAVLAPRYATAQETGILQKGDLAVTSFSGVKAEDSIPSDVHPLDRTFIDPDGAVLRIFDVSNLGGAADGRLVDAPVRFEAKARDIGQVFGVAIAPDDAADMAPDTYAVATSLYGLHIVAPGEDSKYRRLTKGAPAAQWMPGLFGEGKGGGPGSVWKIDGATGDISLFATIRHDGKENAGPGLGGIAFDPVHSQVFVSDLETGFIHRVGLNGTDLGTFDHGETARWAAGLAAAPYSAEGRKGPEDPQFDTEDAATWGYADPRRRVVGLAVQSGRLYYTVFEGPQVWSVGITTGGGFGPDPRLEIDFSGAANSNPITDIAFDGPGAMYLSQRGEPGGGYDYTTFAKPQQAAVVRYRWDESAKSWAETPDEFAIGLKPSHRAGEGGLALGYGYDGAGALSQASCRATLWTTGALLRDGEDEEIVSRGGSRYVNGLQGLSTERGRPLNKPSSSSGARALQGVIKYIFGGPDEAPVDSWFIDADGRFEEADEFGHMGSVAAFAPCEDEEVPVIAEGPVVTTPGVEVPSGGGGIPPFTGPEMAIAKACEPGPIGGLIRCTITVTNIGTESSIAPIVFDDASSVLSGPGTGTPMPIASATPDGPGWSCTPTPTPDFSCFLAGVALPPGASRSVAVFVDTAPLVAAGNLGFRNCATLAWPFVGMACDEAGTELTFQKTGPAACLPVADCTYTLSVTNAGTLPFSGDVVLSDSMYISGGAAGPPITLIVPALGCAPAPAALPFSCTAPLTLAAGETRAFSITVTMPPDLVGTGYWAQNCFAVTAPGLPPPLGPVPPPAPALPGFTGAPSCTWTAVGPVAPMSNLAIGKTALDMAKCSKGAGDIIVCKYEINVRNDGPSPYSHTVSLQETVPAAATLTGVPAGWTCGGGPPAYTCNSDGIVDLAVGALITIPVTIEIPLAPLEAAGCGLTNKVAILDPLGDPLNINAADDTAEATADAFLTWILPGGFVFVTCDPTNIAVKKTPKGDCAKAGNGWRCDWLVTLTNEGPDPYKGPMEVTETFGAATSLASFSAPWDCNGGPASFTCKQPFVDMDPGEVIELHVTAKVPETGACQITNTATMTSPPSGTRFNGKAEDDSASASAKIASPKCERPKPPRCEPGPNEVRSEDGSCRCVEGTVRNSKGRCVSLAPPTVVPTPIDVCTPGRHEFVTEDGSCACERGYDYDEDDVCVRIDDLPPPLLCEPGPHEYRTASGYCVCDYGYLRDNFGRCIRVPEPRCPDGSRPVHGQCLCASDELWSPNLERCVPVDCATLRKRDLPLPRRCGGENRCPDGKPMPANGKCPCAHGLVWNSNRQRCETEPDPHRGCKANDVQCLCAVAGGKWTGSACELPPDPRQDCKKAGGTWRRGKCVMPEDRAIECRKKGGTWTGQTCVMPLSPEEECKKKGGDWRKGKCTLPPSPAEACKDKGGNWTGQTCVMPPSPEDECKKKGGDWRKGKCIVPPSPAEACKDKGGNWTGQTCVMPPSPEDECKKKGGDWRKGKCIVPPSPAEACKDKGGNWTGQTCVMPLSPEEECKKKGGDWRKGKCIVPPSPADACKDKGGTWTGQTCVKPPSPEEQCRKSGGTWKRGKCLPAAEGKTGGKKDLEKQKLPDETESARKAKQLERQKQKEQQSLERQKKAEERKKKKEEDAKKAQELLQKLQQQQPQKK